jgi:hypothetical protein
LEGNKLKYMGSRKEYYEKEEHIISMGPHEWASYFHELFSIKKERMLESPFYIQTLDPSYIAQIDSDFTKGEVK